MRSESRWRAYVGLGANLPWCGVAPEVTVARAVEALGALGEVVAQTGLWRTEPVGPVRAQPLFWNAVVVLETGLGPVELLRELLAVELRFGRERGGSGQGPQAKSGKGPRTLDLDLLLMERVMVGSIADFGNAGAEAPAERAAGFVVMETMETLETEELVLPHPEMARRRFVLAPLAEVAPGLVVPGCGGRTVAELLAALPEGERVERVGALGEALGGDKGGLRSE